MKKVHEILEELRGECKIPPDIDLLDIRTKSWTRSPTSIYKFYKIPKPDGTKRSIEEPIEPLKTIQRCLLTMFNQFPFHPSANGHKGTNATENAIKHMNAKIIVKMDVKQFFPHVREEHFTRAVECILGEDDPLLARKLNLTIPFCFIQSLRGHLRLPTGAPTSPIISSIAFTPVDIELDEMAQRHGMTYTRYIDDLTFSTSEKYHRGFQAEVNGIVKKYGFRLNHKKSQVLYRDNDLLMVTGVAVNNHEPSVGRTYKRQLRAELEYQARQSTKLTKQLEGKLAYVNQVSKVQYNSLISYFHKRVVKYHGI